MASRKKKHPTGLIVFALIVAANVAGLAIFTGLKRARERRAAEAAIAAAAAPTPMSESRAKRAAGLVALEGGKYDEAVRNFTEAAASSEASADLAQLLKIALDLRDRVPAGTVAGETELAEAAPAEGSDKGSDEGSDQGTTSPDEPRPRRERDKDRKPRSARVVKAEETGTIIVSSTPPGLPVLFDGKRLEVTPMRIAATAGPHDLVLLDGNEVVFNKRLTVIAGSLQSVDPDVTTLVAALRASPNPSDPAPPSPGQAIPAASAGLGSVPAGAVGQPQQGAEPKKGSPSPAVALDDGSLYVVAHAGLGLHSISTEQLSSIFMGKTTSLNGRKLEPLLRSPSSAAGAAFMKRVVRVTTRQYRDHWQKIELSGSTASPPVVNNLGDVWRAVGGRSGTLSFALGAELSDAPGVKPVPITE